MRMSVLLSLACAVAWPAVASAQSNSLFGNSGPLGQGGFNSTPSAGGPTSSRGGRTGGSSLGGSSLGGSALGGSALGGSGLGGSSLGGGAMGGSSLGGSSLGGGMGGQQQGVQIGALGQTIGTGPVVGQSDNRGRQVGNRMAGQQSAMGAMQMLQGLQGLQRGGGFNNSNQSSQPDRLPLRPTMRIGFDYTPVSSSAAAQRASTQLTSVFDRRPELAGIVVTSGDDGNVVLTGNAKSEETARLAAALVRLEPGVRDVVINVTIGEAP